MKVITNFSFNSFTSHSIWSVLGFGIAQGSSLIVFVVLARLLSKDEIASFALMQSFAAVGMTCCGLWIGTGVTRFVALNAQKDKLAAGRYSFLGIISTTILSLLCSFFLFIFSDFFSIAVIGSDYLSPYLKIISIIIIFQSIDSVQMQTLQSLVAFKEISKNNLIKAIFYIPIIILATYNYGLNGVFYGLLIMSLIVLVVNAFSIKKYFLINSIRYIPAFKYSEFRIFYSYALPLFFGALLGTPVILIANSLLSQGDLGIQEVAYFAIASQWRSLIQHIPKRMTDVALPMLSSSYGADNEEDFNSTFMQANAFSILIACTLVTFLFFNVSLISSLYGDEYDGANNTIILMLLSGAISCFGSGIGPLIYSKGYTRFGLFTNLIWTTTFLLVSVSFIDVIGSASLALGMCVAYIVNLSITVMYLSFKKDISIELLYKYWLGILIMILVSGLSLLTNQVFSLIYVFFISIISSIVIFLLLLNYIIDRNMKLKMFNFFRNLKDINNG